MGVLRELSGETARSRRIDRRMALPPSPPGDYSLDGGPRVRQGFPRGWRNAAGEGIG